jgi:hypothetical protein
MMDICNLYNFSEVTMPGNMAPGSGNQIKLSVGKIVIQIKTEILELMAEYKVVYHCLLKEQSLRKQLQL